MKTYDLYAFQADDLEGAREVIESLLEVTLVAHDSLYVGAYYLGQTEDEQIQLRRNLDPLDDELIERNTPHLGFLVYVNNTERAHEIENRLFSGVPGIVLLKRLTF